MSKLSQVIKSLVRAQTIDKAQVGPSQLNQRTVLYLHANFYTGRLLPLLPDTGLYRPAVKNCKYNCKKNILIIS